MVAVILLQGSFRLVKLERPCLVVGPFLLISTSSNQSHVSFFFSFDLIYHLAFNTRQSSFPVVKQSPFNLII
ncbi:hypothetical protein F4860DRAFT_474478 [Xylaria cubensis]|nr:hypothetical protein F4860DRAFT_474478 [Xylaria cubensis]